MFTFINLRSYAQILCLFYPKLFWAHKLFWSSCWIEDVMGLGSGFKTYISKGGGGCFAIILLIMVLQDWPIFDSGLQSDSLAIHPVLQFLLYLHCPCYSTHQMIKSYGTKQLHSWIYIWTQNLRKCISLVLVFSCAS